MLPELIYREEQQDNYILLFVLGAISAVLGYYVASLVFPAYVSVLAVVFAAIPLVYPMTRTFLEDEREGRPHIDEIYIYGSLFAGEVLGFFILSLTVAPETLSAQISQFAVQLDGMGIEAISGSGLEAILTGEAVSPVGFKSILLNNLTVFSIILTVSALISSSGAFILVWNASVLGTFLGVLMQKVSGAAPLAYVPHATLEMGGFIIAGISGSLISAAIYREHFDRKTWIDYLKLLGLGVSLIVVAALVETA